MNVLRSTMFAYSDTVDAYDMSVLFKPRDGGFKPKNYPYLMGLFHLQWYNDETERCSRRSA